MYRFTLHCRLSQNDEPYSRVNQALGWSLLCIAFHWHWFDWVFQSLRRFFMDSSNFLTWEPGFKIFTSLHWEQGSIHQLFRPEHHAPGRSRLRPRFKIFRSTMSNTESSLWNFRANAAPLSAMTSKFDTLRNRGSIFGGSSQIINLRSLLTVLFLNSFELQLTEWKYPSWDKTMLLKYMRSVRGRLSHPRMQNSRNDRLRKNQGEPAMRRR